MTLNDGEVKAGGKIVLDETGYLAILKKLNRLKMWFSSCLVFRIL
jgi:hypothetical protein